MLFLRSPFTTNVRTFDTTPVEPSHPLAGVKAFPVLGGTAAYKPADLVDLFQVQRQCSDADAAREVQDVPWHLLHECPAEGPTTPTYGMCTSCGSVEVELVEATGTRDLSGIGESASYPTGHGCEVCA